MNLNDKPDALAPPTPPPASPLSDRNDQICYFYSLI